MKQTRRFNQHFTRELVWVLSVPVSQTLNEIK